MWKQSYRPNLPHIFYEIVVDKWKLSDYTLLLRTQPDMLHKYQLRKTQVENIYKNTKKQSFEKKEWLIINHSLVEVMAGLHESKYAIDILCSRINTNRIMVSLQHKKLLQDYFNDIKKHMRATQQKCIDRQIDNVYVYFSPFGEIHGL